MMTLAHNKSIVVNKPAQCNFAYIQIETNNSTEQQHIHSTAVTTTDDDNYIAASHGSGLT
jgi:hypothetical protein